MQLNYFVGNQTRLIRITMSIFSIEAIMYFYAKYKYNTQKKKKENAREVVCRVLR